MTRLQTVINEMADIVDENVEDPNKYRRNDNGSWVYSHFPKYGDNATLPRIGFHKIGATYTQKTLGSTAANLEADVQASILVKRGKKYDFDNDGENEEEEDLASYLVEQVVEQIKQNQQQLLNLGDDVSYAIPLTGDSTRPPNQNFIIEAVPFEVRIDDC